MNDRHISLRPHGVSVRSVLRWTCAVGAGLVAVSTPAAAHAGTTHAGTPHWLLFVLLVVGLGTMLSAVAAARRSVVTFSVAVGVVAAGALAAVFGGIGLVELQVVAQTPPQLVAIYPLVSLAVGSLLAVGGFVVVLRRWPQKPQYAALCLVLAAWVVYPSLLQTQGYRHPLGYLIVLSLPVVLGYIVWTDARALLQSLRLQRTPAAAGVAAGVLMSVFFAFSAGTMSFNPDQGVGMPTHAFVIPYEVASPLVIWPAIEWYVPSIPFAGYLSVGTLLLMVVLGGLVGLNVAVVAQQLSAAEKFAGKQMLAGSLATSGATACCCCAPAFYGVLSVLFGSAATPVYWSFMIPSSPVGSTFFAVSVLLLVGSLLRSTGATIASR